MLTLWTLQFSLLVVTVIVVLKPSLGKKKPRNTLPGPTGLPWLGPVWEVDATSIHLTFQRWAQKYGAIYQVTIFGQRFAVVTDPRVAKELLARQAAASSDRPAIALIDDSRESGKYLPFLGNNDVLHKQRRFGVLLSNFTAQNDYHDRMQPEVQRLLVSLLKKTDHYDLLAEKCCARVTCQIAFGDAAPAAEIVRNAHRLMKNLSPGGRLTNVLTPMKLLPAWLSDERLEENRRKEYETRLWGGIFRQAQARHVAGELEASYASYYFSNKSRLGLSDLEATHGIGMLATVAILTVTAPLARFIIAVTKYPEWQIAVQEELDAVQGGNMFKLSDLPQLPTLRAVVLETMRWTSPLPTGIPHRTEADIHWHGYTIQAGTNIMACDWAMARNAEIYPDPDEFNPNRYLDPSSPNYRAPLTEFPKIQGHHAFGFGRRICIGQDYAAAELLTLCAALMWGFDIRPRRSGTGEPMHIEADKATPHVIPIPERQNLEFIVRNEAKRNAIQHLELSFAT